MSEVGSDTIVVGIDSSPSSEVALRWAIDEAARTGRRLHIVNVWHWADGAVGSPMALVGHEDPHTAGRHLLTRAVKQAEGSNVVVTSALAEGGTASQLTDAAAGAAMLVVGRHGHGKIRHSIMGSVSKACIQHARSPVLVVPDE
ncbi:MAG: universal stress protein [Acidobacteriota bacterium]|nr:universal stress protein [Acidobacteriota bacterium]